MACNASCATFAKQAYSFDTTSNIFYKNSACSGTTHANVACVSQSFLAVACGGCSGCSYWTTNGAGLMSCWTDSGCTTPCGGADEFGGIKDNHFYQIGIWVGLSCLALALVYIIYRKKASKQ